MQTAHLHGRREFIEHARLLARPVLNLNPPQRRQPAALQHGERAAPRGRSVGVHSQRVQPSAVGQPLDGEGTLTRRAREREAQQRGKRHAPAPAAADDGRRRSVARRQLLVDGARDVVREAVDRV